MTITSTVARNDYTGANNTGPFAYTFKVFAYSQLVAYVTDLSGNITTLSWGAGFSATGAQNAAGGTITLNVALTTGYALSIQRNVALTQLYDFRNQGEFFPATYEDAQDYGRMVDQELAATLAHCFQLPAASAISPIIGVLTAGDYLRVNLSGTGIEAVSTVVAAQNFLQSGTGAVTRSANAKMAEIVSVKDFGATGDGVTDDTAAFTAARVQQIATGQAIFVPTPPVTYLVSSLSMGGSTVPFVMYGESGTWESGVPTTSITFKATASIGVQLGGIAAGQLKSVIRDIAFVGNATMLGGIALGTSTTYAAYTTLERVTVTGFTGVGAYGISLNSVQELNSIDCAFIGNYNNVYRPTGGYVTSTRIGGYAGYIGRATNLGVNLVGVVQDIMFDKIVIEGNLNGGVKSTGAQSYVILNDCYVEANAEGGGSQVSLTGTSGAFQQMNCSLTRNRFHAGPLNPTAPVVSLDYVSMSSIRDNFAMLQIGGGVVTTANTQADFKDNAGVGSPDAATIYPALLGTITAEDTDVNGVRFVFGQMRRIGLPTSSAGLTSGEQWLNTNVVTNIP